MRACWRIMLISHPTLCWAYTSKNQGHRGLKDRVHGLDSSPNRSYSTWPPNSLAIIRFYGAQRFLVTRPVVIAVRVVVGVTYIGLGSSPIVGLFGGLSRITAPTGDVTIIDGGIAPMQYLGISTKLNDIRMTSKRSAI